jgi:hypothetical protein
MKRTAATRARYTIVQIEHDILLLEDTADGALSVTNDAENVIADLADKELLCNPSGQLRRVAYLDSFGRWDEILHDGSEFVAFSMLGSRTQQDAIKALREP